MKKWIIVLIAVLVVAGSVIGFLLSRGGNYGTGVTGGNSGQIGIIQLPESKLKVVFNGPPELEARWDKIGMVSYQIQVIGTITNKSSGTVEFAQIIFMLDGQQVDFIYYGTSLRPGETMQIAKGFAGYDEKSKILEIKVDGFKKTGGGSQPTNQTTTTPPATTTPAAKETPAEVVMKWFGLHRQGKFKEALELYDQTEKNRIGSKGGADYLKKQWDKKPITKLTVIETTHEKGSTPPQANVYVNISYADGTYVPDGIFNFEYIDGVWKITYSEGR